MNWIYFLNSGGSSGIPYFYVEEETLQVEEDMKKRYPRIFESRENEDEGNKFPT